MKEIVYHEPHKEVLIEKHSDPLMIIHGGVSVWGINDKIHRNNNLPAIIDCTRNDSILFSYYKLGKRIKTIIQYNNNLIYTLIYFYE